MQHLHHKARLRLRQLVVTQQSRWNISKGIPRSSFVASRHFSNHRMRLPSRTLVGASVLPLLFFVSQSNSFFIPFPNSSQSSSLSSSSFAGIKTVASSSGENGMASFQEALENSWVRNLSTETEINYQRSRAAMALPQEQDNRTKRPVYNGHYVPVKPKGIKNPQLVLYSQDVAENLLHLSDSEMVSDDFVNYVSGNLILGETWATPYALSIMGKRYTNNCPFGTGDGYGDGRAISIGEAHGFELQLKGAGPTPFHRGADGRAVLRSSIREFLASEAMHWLGVPTTRALSLVVSEKGDTVNRPWYSNDVVMQVPKMNDPRLEKYSEKQKREIIQRLRQQKADPNMMISEPCAITCRVSPSFTRIGHLDLFARRAERASQLNADETDSRYDTSTLEWKELEDLIWHACYREFREEAYEPYYKEKNIEKAATVLLERSAEKIATMVAHWIRVGFAQGNFNADNCLVGGRTMDYGPFGWMEEYSPVFAKWTGSGEHFGFFNQPSAGYANYEVLVTSVIQVICAAKGEENQDETYAYFMGRAQSLFQDKLGETLRTKLGFQADEDIADDLWENLEPLLRSSRIDWTLFWRQLTNIAEKLSADNLDSEEMMSLLQGDGDSSPFYDKLDSSTREQWITWLENWRDMLDSSKTKNIHEHMRTTNPKYVLREWMLVSAYTDAGLGDVSTLQELYQLIQDPYGEGTASQEENFYRRAPDSALTTGGTAFMS